MLVMILGWQSMSLCNSYFIAATGAPIDPRVRGFFAWPMFCIERLMVRVGQVLTVLIERHNFLL
jgi:hypothetical protein